MDENSNIAGDGAAPKATVTITNTAAAVEDRNPSSISDVTANSNGGDRGGASQTGSEVARTQSARTPFTNLSQEDADLALARTLQEQERAYMMLSMGGGTGYGRWDTGLYVHDDEDDGFGDSHNRECDDIDDEDNENDEEDEDGVENSDDDEEEEDEEEEDEDEDAFDVHAHADSEDDGTDTVELDPSAYPGDEAYARVLQDAEEREMAARLLAMAGISEREIVDVEDHESNSQDIWEDVDPDELSYEELIALGEVVGTESRGLSADVIATLPSSNYISKKSEEDEPDSCVICRLDYEDDDVMTTLACKHAYHSDCIINWLKINKACPVCSAEVSTSGNS